MTTDKGTISNVCCNIIQLTNINASIDIWLELVLFSMVMVIVLTYLPSH